MLYLIFFVIFILGIFILFSFRKKKKLSITQKKAFFKVLGEISHETHLEQQILSADKLYHKILLAYGFSGTFGEILKKNPQVIGDIQLIWNLHKVRNKLAHDLEKIDQKTLKNTAVLYISELHKILK